MSEKSVTPVVNDGSPTNHGEQIRVVDGSVEPFALVQVWSVEDPGDCQTIISSEGVNDHGATSISALWGTRGTKYRLVLGTVLSHRTAMKSSAGTTGFGETHVQEGQDDVLLHGKQRDAEQGDDHELDRTDFAQEGPVGDERAGTAEVCVD